ncbi:DUF742 domain-containing protein [Planobispora longispora]|uniref:DUF742 domain-containing protein n=1 Tax=Planobispora longispora TaxID=28887 RepID=A0A8J3RHI1_9ACTN|nr:DUF742 domain-containing protein [Planobispora longispora]GIH74910.1 hypothetical protein Plo01_13390 [Planobispora longispora]
MSGPHWHDPPGEDGHHHTPKHSRPPYGDAAEESSLVRMYTVTGGRTTPRNQLAIEALVSSATSGILGMSFTREYRAISEMCRQVRSVAEISALLGVPLSVARVLVSDMEAEGLVRVYHPPTRDSGPASDILERVLHGLRRL